MVARDDAGMTSAGNGVVAIDGDEAVDLSLGTIASCTFEHVRGKLMVERNTPRGLIDGKGSREWRDVIHPN
jgi:hypothetical protein